MVIPNSVTRIGQGAFSHCKSLTDIQVADNNGYYTEMDGSLYTKDGKTLIRYASSLGSASFKIPDGVTSICEHAFSGCESLTNITISDSMEYISESTFVGCNLTICANEGTYSEEYARKTIFVS